jgi:hypothetical protein
MAKIYMEKVYETQDTGHKGTIASFQQHNGIYEYLEADN